MKVRGVVVINLARLDLTDQDAASTARAAIWAAVCETPAGVDVRLIVPRWGWWCRFAAEELRQYGDHINEVVVESDAATVRRWVLALRYGVDAVDQVRDR